MARFFVWHRTGMSVLVALLLFGSAAFCFSCNATLRGSASEFEQRMASSSEDPMRVARNVADIQRIHADRWSIAGWILTAQGAMFAGLLPVVFLLQRRAGIANEFQPRLAGTAISFAGWLVGIAGMAVFLFGILIVPWVVSSLTGRPYGCWDVSPASALIGLVAEIGFFLLLWLPRLPTVPWLLNLVILGSVLYCKHRMGQEFSSPISYGWLIAIAAVPINWCARSLMVRAAKSEASRIIVKRECSSYRSPFRARSSVR
jgi:hypothetical protein